MRSRHASQDRLMIKKTSIQNINTNTISQNKQIKQCRICLQNEQETTNHNYITPCKCIGSVMYVHQQCIKTWIFSSMKSKDRKQKYRIQHEGIACEMCKYVIKFDMEISLGCNNCSQVKNLIKIKYVLFIVTVLLVLLASGGFGFALSRIFVNLDQFEVKTGIKFQYILAICGSVLLFLFAILGSYTLIGQFFIKTHVQLGKILDDRQAQNKNKVKATQIVPILDQSDIEIVRYD